MTYLIDFVTNLNILIWLAVLIAIYFFVYLIRMFLHNYFSYHRSMEKDILLVTLPKEKIYDTTKQQQEEKKEVWQEQIGIMETLYSSIGGMNVKKNIINWVIGRDDALSLEIVSKDGLISFYLAVPKKIRRFIEQQINAYFPEAQVEDSVDYNIFSPKSKVFAARLSLQRQNIFPIKTYHKFGADPLNSLTNILSKLQDDEGAAIQFIIRPANKSWRKLSRKFANEVYKTQDIKKAIHRVSSLQFFSSFENVLDIVLQKSNKEKNETINNENRKLSSREEEMIKEIEEKSSKAGLEVNIRLIVSSEDEKRGDIYLTNLLDVFSQYNIYGYGNSFKRASILSKNKFVKDFIYRTFDRGKVIILNTEEFASIYHFPLPTTETPNIRWLTAKKSAAPVEIPSEGIVLGRNIFRGIEKLIHIKRDDRRRHAYVIGKSGTGKSVLLANMAIQDIANGEGVCVIDPHGDLVEDILTHIPRERAEDVIYFKPADIQRPMGLNLLEYDKNYPEQKTFVINEMIKIFDKLYDLKSTGGPIFEQYMRNSMLLIMDDPNSGSTLMEISKVLSDPNFRKYKLSKCHDQTVVDFWKKEAEKAGGEAALANIVPYVTSKLTSFISNDTMRPIIAQQKSAFNLREIMDQRKILLLNLSKGQLGDLNAYLIGMIMVGKILIAALSRTDIPQEKRKDFYLYIDEFQNFITDSIAIILSEARKYRLNLIIAHQYIGQLVKNQDTTIRDAVFGNVGTFITFKIGSEDAEFLVKEYQPVFNQYDLINIKRFNAYVKLLVDNNPLRPFSMQTFPLVNGNLEMAERIKSLSRLKYGRDRNIVEAEIMRRGNIKFN